MSNDPFSSAIAESSGLRVADLEGRLLLITPLEYVPEVKTNRGEVTDAVDCEIVVLDGENAPDEIDNFRFWQGMIIKTLKRDIGKLKLHRIGKGEKTKGNAPWVLLKPSDADKDTARAYLESKKTDPFST